MFKDGAGRRDVLCADDGKAHAARDFDTGIAYGVVIVNHHQVKHGKAIEATQLAQTIAENPGRRSGGGRLRGDGGEDGSRSLNGKT